MAADPRGRRRRRLDRLGDYPAEKKERRAIHISQKQINITIGQRFGKLRVISAIRRTGGGRAFVSCQCDCGSIVTVRCDNLLSGHSRSCGCSKNGGQKKQRTSKYLGKRFGRIVITGLSQQRYDYHWVCQCDCGTVFTATPSNVLSGKTTSCGCFRSDRVSTHHETKTRLHNIWKGMRQRCRNPHNKSFKYYGQRGICLIRENHKLRLFSQ